MRLILLALVCAVLVLPAKAVAVNDPGQESFGSDSYITCELVSYDGEWTILCWPNF